MWKHAGIDVTTETTSPPFWAAEKPQIIHDNGKRGTAAAPRRQAFPPTEIQKTAFQISVSLTASMAGHMLLYDRDIALGWLYLTRRSFASVAPTGLPFGALKCGFNRRMAFSLHTDKLDIRLHTF